MLRNAALLLLSLALVPAVSAVDVANISPSSGPSAGGTTVRITGNFSPASHSVVFGGVPAVSVQRIDSRTIEAITPAHLPGESNVLLIPGNDILSAAIAEFEFEGEIPDAFERILLPIFTPPLHGALGSEFRTTFGAWNASATKTALVFGAERSCTVCFLPPIPPEDLINFPVAISPREGPDSLLGSLIPSGSPGRFLYVRADEAKELAATLRVHDVSRAALNLGTEIPVVRAREFVTSEVLALPGVPNDSRFRNTLRIYATAETDVLVTFIRALGPSLSQRVQRTVHLTPTPRLRARIRTDQRFPGDRVGQDARDCDARATRRAGADVGVHLRDEQRDAGDHHHHAAAVTRQNKSRCVRAALIG